MNQRMDDDLSGEVASKRPASTAVAAVGSLSTSCSRDGEDFQAQVERNIQAARHGHGGLETALHLMCERLLDLGVCWEEMLKEQKRAEEKYLELQQDCLDQQKHLSTLNDSLRQDLCVLESRVEDLARAKASLPKNESTNDEIVGVVEMMVAAATCGRNVDVETIPAIRQELLALKRKVDIIAANVLGEAESMNMETASATGGVEKEGPLLYNSDDDIAGERGKDVEEPLLCNRYHDIAGKRRNDFGQVAQCIAGIFGKEKISDSRRHMDGDREAANDNGGDARYHEEEGGDSRKHKLRTRARNRWVKVRMNRAFLVKKIRRQVMAERKVSQSETVVTRVERLEKALGVNVYTTGSGRLDVLGREVRLSLAMIVEHQVRVASHVEERGGSSRGDTSRSGSGTAANEDEGTTGHDTEGSEGGSVAKFHEQLAKAMRAERDRLEQNNDERARAERERVSQLLETQLGHLTSLLDSKAGQEDLVSITRAMGDVEETLQVVRESVPGENILQELQEALARKADKAYTKRQMALLVSRVSALLKEESDEPAMAKKCLSCDRAFNKLSFKELELAQKLPDVLESVLDAPMHAPQQLQKQQKQRALGGTDGGGGGGGGGLERVRWAGGDWPREAMNGDEFRPPRGRSEQDANKRPGSAPIARARNTLEPRPFSGKRPNSAAPQRLGGGGGTGSITGSSRAGSGGVLPRTAPGRCANPNNNSRSLPPAVARPQPTYRQSLLFLPAALSATYGQHSDSAGKIVESETLRADRVSAREQAPTLDHLRYGGMTEAPLVKQLFAGLGAGIGGRSSSGVSTLVGAAGAQARGTVGARIVTGRWGQGESIAMRGTGGRGRRNGGGYSAVDSGGATGRAADDRMPSGGSGDSREDFSSTLEHHRRNVIAVDEPPV